MGMMKPDKRRAARRAVFLPAGVSAKLKCPGALA